MSSYLVKFSFVKRISGVLKESAGADRACRALGPARPEPVDDGSASSGCERQSTTASSRHSSKDAMGDYSLSEDDDEHEEYPEFLRRGFVKFF